MSLVIFVSLRTAAIAVAPFSPTPLPERLPSEGRGAGMPRGDDTKANARELVREAGGLLERLQRRVSLQALCNRGSSFGTERVVLETARVGFGGE